MSLRPSSAARKNGYKKAVSGDEARRKREEKLVQIRKSKRLDSLKKRRNGSLLNDNAHLHHLQPKVFLFPCLLIFHFSFFLFFFCMLIRATVV